MSLFGSKNNDQPEGLTWEDDDWEPEGFDYDEAKHVASEQLQSPDVRYARPVTAFGKTHVHLDLEDGDIVVFGADGQALQIEGEWYPEEDDEEYPAPQEEHRPWWKFW